MNRHDMKKRVSVIVIPTESLPKKRILRGLKSMDKSDVSQIVFHSVNNPILDPETELDDDIPINNDSSNDSTTLPDHPPINVSNNEEDDHGDTIEKVYIEGICKAGYLKKKSTGIGKGWLKRFFFLKDGKLFYVYKHTDLIGHNEVNARQIANLMISTVKEKCTCEFQVVSPGLRNSHNASGGGMYELQGESEDDVREWIKIIRQEIEGALAQICSVNTKINQADSGSSLFIPCAQQLTELRTANPYCADCGTVGPEWASLNLGKD